MCENRIDRFDFDFTTHRKSNRTSPMQNRIDRFSKIDPIQIATTTSLTFYQKQSSIGSQRHASSVSKL